MSWCYQPLEPSLHQIRLLTLLPPVNGRIIGSLHIVSLQDRPVFNALSYVWGNEDDPEPININGQALVAKKNLTAVLRQLQESESQPIWIDAICIDQQNLKEKGFQLPLMRAIYKQVLRVLVWLGEGNPDVEALFQIVLHLEAEDFLGDSFRKQKDSEKAYTWFTEFLLLPYWQRMWTYQELALPHLNPICMYAGYRCDLASFFKARSETLLFYHPVDSLEEAMANLHPSKLCDVPDTMKIRILKSVEAGHSIYTARNVHMNSDQTLGSLLYATVGRKCFDPRDRFYALYGMAERPRLCLPADYGANNTIERVLVSTAFWIMNEEFDTSSLIFLVFGMRASRFSQDLLLPSWIPDFDMQSTLCKKQDVAKCLRRRSTGDIRPATHEGDAVVLVGWPGIGIVATGEPRHTAIPASFNQCAEAMEFRRTSEEGEYDMKFLEPDSSKAWEVIQLPAWKPKPLRAVEHGWNDGPDTPESLSFHLTLSILGDMPLLRISARNLGQCHLHHRFGPDVNENQFFIASILWSSRQELDLWKMTLHVLNYTLDDIGGFQGYTLLPVYPSEAELQQPAYRQVVSDYRDLIEFWEGLCDQSTEVVSNESVSQEQLLKQDLSHFTKACALKMVGLDAFWVNIQDKACLGFAPGLVETGDVVILPLDPYRYPLLLRRENPNTDTSGKYGQEGSFHGCWNNLVFHRMVGSASIQDLVDESDFVARVAEQGVEDFYIR